MYPLFESIALKDGVILHPSWHQKRFQKSYQTLYGQKPNFSLFDNVNLPEDYNKGLYKLRISYYKLGTKVEFQSYKPKPIKRLKIVDGSHMDYSIKFQDRDELNKLYNKREACDDILIIREGLITDSSYANIIFYDDNSWYTPHVPLLHGTARARLLEEGKIIETKIGINDLGKYTSFKLINALRGIDEVEIGSVKDIVR